MSERAKSMMAGFKARNMTEQVIYRPAAGDPLTIDALVDRPGPEEFAKTSAPVIRIQVLSDGEEGILPASLDVGADRIDVSDRVGGQVASRNIRRIVEQDNEFMIVEVT